MTDTTNSLAKDLSETFPRSPHEKLGGFVVAARTVDKCRAVLAGTAGEYHFDCPLDNFFFAFAGITADDLKAILAQGADDEVVGQWIAEKSSQSEEAIKLWNMEMAHKRIPDMPKELQLFLHDYIPQYIPENRRVYTWFDVYDIEEGRI